MITVKEYVDMLDHEVTYLDNDAKTIKENVENIYYGLVEQQQMLKFWKLCLHKLALQKHSLVLNNFDSVKVRKILGSNKKDLIQYVSSLFKVLYC